MDTLENTATGMDPWRDTQPECRVFPESQWFQKVLRDFLGDAVRFVGRPDAADRAAVLVDCTESAESVRTAPGNEPSAAVAKLAAPVESATPAGATTGPETGPEAFAT